VTSDRIRRIAVIADVHANLPALEAALAAIDALGCDAIVHTGDAIGIGPYPAETLARMLATPAMRFVMGNHDAWFALGLPDGHADWMDPGEMTHHHWVNAQPSAALRAVVATWPFAIVEEIAGTRVLFTHYAQPDGRGGFAPIAREPSPANLDALFGEIEADVVFYGHHHPRSDLVGRARYVNPGALGCHDVAVARFAVLDVTPDGGFAVELHEAPYDATPVLRAMAEREVPEREMIRDAFLRFPD
jgi:putative phosphoesterase